MDNILDGIKVVDLSTVLAGPSVATFLAELGAEVIKIENANSKGDVTRTWKNASENSSDAVSAYFSSVNYKKSYRFLDLKLADHINEVYRLLKDADIVIHNYKSGDDYKFGLDYDRVKSINPKIIYGHISGFDSDPARVAYDVVIQAECGYMYMNGTPQTEPLKMPLAFMDVLAAHQLKEGILSGLLRKQKSGRGCKVSCSLEAAALAGLTNQASNYLMSGLIPQRMGSLHPNIAPYGDTFECLGGDHIVLAIGSDSHFQKLCVLLGIEELSSDDKFSTNPARVSHRNELQKALATKFKLVNRDEILKSCHAQHIPAGGVKSMDEVFSNPTAQAMIRTEDISNIQTKRMSSIAFKISE